MFMKLYEDCRPDENKDKKNSQVKHKKRFSSALQFKITIIDNKNNTITCK